MAFFTCIWLKHRHLKHPHTSYYCILQVVSNTLVHGFSFSHFFSPQATVTNRAAKWHENPSPQDGDRMPVEDHRAIIFGQLHTALPKNVDPQQRPMFQRKTRRMCTQKSLDIKTSASLVARFILGTSETNSLTLTQSYLR